MSPSVSYSASLDSFLRRHIGPQKADIESMLELLDTSSLEALCEEAVPASIRLGRPLDLPAARTEQEALADLAALAGQNEVFRSHIGQGYYDTVVPAVILRNIMENPGWYTQYTPYQPEIAQGRLEALVNFQTMVADLTGLPLANSSLLDEATAAAEAMAMCRAVGRGKRSAFFVSDACHPQTIEVMRTRADSMGMELRTGDANSNSLDDGDLCGVLLQYPDTSGAVHDWTEVIGRAKAAGLMVVMATDLLALCVLKSPGALGADIAVGSSQRFGVPMGLGGPHAGFLSTHDKHARKLPGRIVGVSKDRHGTPAYRLALQTREQHIRRDRATSNICTAQVLLAIMAGMYAVYHGPRGLRHISERVHRQTCHLARGIELLGGKLASKSFFDTIRVHCTPEQSDRVVRAAHARRRNLRRFPNGDLGVAIDETTTDADVHDILTCFAPGGIVPPMTGESPSGVPKSLDRPVDYLTHENFQRYQSEHEMLRYLFRLQGKDLSLAHAMIPLGSCTMKLNATAEMIPVTWPAFGGLHPFAPMAQWTGYAELFRELESWLAELTGFDAISLQPNAGSQGEYAGLLAIRGYLQAQGTPERDVCLIPVSAHGTNPASAITAGFRVVAVGCDEQGNIDLEDLQRRARENASTLGALMITYPSTHGVFEERIEDICGIVHEHGGQVYLDGANMNAQVGLCRPGDYGADVCHLNLHKTFCIPHGGGGPGMGPIGVKGHLAPHLPGHPEVDLGHSGGTGPVSAAPFGSPSILPISWMYIAMMGGEGLTRATQVAILNANYMAERLRDHYDIVYTGQSGRVAHEFILDARGFKQSAGISVDDIAKRLMDYGFHAPTMSWPVTGTLMVEPTESEAKEELDRFCDAMIAIRKEIAVLERGEGDREDNPLVNAPHTALEVGGDDWNHSYPRSQAGWPTAAQRRSKFWPPVGRVDNAWGDRNLMCTCPPMSEFVE